MNSLNRSFFVVFSALVISQACSAEEPQGEDEPRYRSVRPWNELMSEATPKAASPVVPNAIDKADVPDAVEPPTLNLMSYQFRDLINGELDLTDGDADSIDADSIDADSNSDLATIDDDANGDDEDSLDLEDDKTDLSEDFSRARLFAAMPSIRTVSLNSAVTPGIMPKDYGAMVFAGLPSEFQPAGYLRSDSFPIGTQWTAPWVAYRPLYFEDPWLERHGYNHRCLQPIVSAAKFYGRIPLLPYMVGATACSECTYSLGRGRPGDCPPHFFTIPKKSCRGALYQAAFVAGTVFLTP